MRRRHLIAALALALVGIAPVAAQSAQVLDLPTPRGVQQRILALRPAVEPERVLVLLTGGGGALGIFDNGSLRQDGNFLVRSRSLFVQQGQAVVLVDTPSDRRELRGDFRESAEHAQDLGAVVAWARRSFGKPVWIVGTSRGTQSAANAAVRLAGEAAQDACQVCPPRRLPELMARLPAGRSTLKTYEGGSSQGPLCEPLAFHGFNGIEDRVVGDMVAWMREAK